MQRYILNALVASCLFLLTACQTNSIGNVFSPYPSGATLAHIVEQELSHNEDPELAQVHVTMSGNTVVLTGYVKKIRQSDAAEQIAHQVPGVHFVENNIIIRQ